MEPVIVFGVWATIMGVSLWLSEGKTAARQSRWQRAAKAVGMTDITHTKAFLGAGVLRGKSGDLNVELSEYTEHKEVHTQVAVRRFTGISLQNEAEARLARVLMGAREIEIGDPP